MTRDDERQFSGHYGMCVSQGHPRECANCAEQWRRDPLRPRPCLVCQRYCRSEGQLCLDCVAAGHRVTDDSVIVVLSIGGAGAPRRGAGA